MLPVTAARIMCVVGDSLLRGRRATIVKTDAAGERGEGAALRLGSRALRDRDLSAATGGDSLSLHRRGPKLPRRRHPRRRKGTKLTTY